MNIILYVTLYYTMLRFAVQALNQAMMNRLWCLLKFPIQRFLPHLGRLIGICIQHFNFQAFD